MDREITEAQLRARRAGVWAIRRGDHKGLVRAIGLTMVLGIAFLIELKALNGRAKLAGADVRSFITY